MDRPDDSALEQTQTTADSRLSSTSSPHFAEEGRFLPGTLLGGRYRIIGLLGRGGMGEVYRATDLTLGQSVALKFLPEQAARDERLLERFHGEVRVARQVSHPNVCRVYDIGEVDGMPFISMEYVDGEDLASLLLRIGRLPADKAVETARKICAGLAAAHDKGIVHRDLKPHNIMMNKRGQVVIMDFGLAAITDQLSGADVRSGTPAYMAPEQLKGAGVTPRSDIYTLGLVLYELFTGKKPYEAKSVRELIDRQESAQLTSMTSIAADIDPAVEKAIRRCLNPDPAQRPASALAVAAALPGGDPLAAALAAGETPSPELVAASGETQGMARRYSVPLLAMVALCLVGSIPLRQRGQALMHAPADYSPEVLAQKARETAAALGYSKKPADSAVWLFDRGGVLSHLKALPQPKKWDEWLAAESPIMAEYRESQSMLIANPFGEVKRQNPPAVEPGMVHVQLDGNGRLREFLAVPYDGPTVLKEPVQPEVLFRAAGLDMAKFKETTPGALPPYAADQLRAWEGPHPVLPTTELIIEMASWKGRVTMFKVVFPWHRPKAPQPGPSPLRRLLDEIPFMGVIAFMVFLVLMARRNWRLGRMDRKGAMRLAVARCLLAMVAWIGTVHPVPDTYMFVLFYQSLADWLLSAALVWLLYVALEPAVRARWPHAIVTWNRLLAGRWLDAQVGAHVLIGAAAGSLIFIGASAVNLWGAQGALEGSGSMTHALGARQFVASLAGNLGGVLAGGLMAFFLIFGLRRLLRKDVLAALAAAVAVTAIRSDILQSPDWAVQVAIYLSLHVVLIFLLLRYGLVVTVAAMFYINATNAVTLGADWKAWYAASGIATLVVLLGIAVFAFWRSLGSGELLGDS